MILRIFILSLLCFSMYKIFFHFKNTKKIEAFVPHTEQISKSRLDFEIPKKIWKNRQEIPFLQKNKNYIVIQYIENQPESQCFVGKMKLIFLNENIFKMEATEKLKPSHLSLYSKNKNLNYFYELLSSEEFLKNRLMLPCQQWFSFKKLNLNQEVTHQITKLNSIIVKKDCSFISQNDNIIEIESTSQFFKINSKKYSFCFENQKTIYLRMTKTNFLQEEYFFLKKNLNFKKTNQNPLVSIKNSFKIPEIQKGWAHK